MHKLKFECSSKQGGSHGENCPNSQKEGVESSKLTERQTSGLEVPLIKACPNQNFGHFFFFTYSLGITQTEL